MTNCNEEVLSFPAVNSKKVEAKFKGGDITSDGGGLLLRAVDQRFSLTKRLARLIPDSRDPSKIKHSIQTMLKQRVFGIALGYEDLNDQDQLRNESGFQTILGTENNAGSSSTLCRFENRINRDTCTAMSELMFEHFIQVNGKPDGPLILDFDATGIPVHGDQEEKFFHGYYDHYCFLPLYVFCGDFLLCSYLRPSRSDGARHAWAILSILVKRFRQVWPDVKIIFRGDSGFSRHKMFNWCERHKVSYIAGIARNKRLEAFSEDLQNQAKEQYETTEQKQRLFTEFSYAAGSWKRERRIIAKAEYTERGANNRYIVTNLSGDPQELYDEVYCQRGKMEQSIDEQLDFYADRTSCHNWYPNQFRLLLSSFAYLLVNEIRRVGLKGTELYKARCSTIRLKLLKIGAIVLRNTRRIQLLLAENCPYKDLFRIAYQQLKSG